MRLAFCLALLLVPQRSAPLSELADRLADEIVRIAAERSVEIGTPEDRTGRGATLALDLRALVLARLEGRARAVEAGPRFRVALVLSETARTLVASGRVIEEPSGRLIDLISASVHGDAAVLTLSPARVETGNRTLEVTANSRTPPVDGPVLDVAFLGDDRLVLLTPEAVAVYRWASPGLVLEHREPLTGARAPVRVPAGILGPEEGGSALWVMTNQIDGATLFAVEAGTLSRRARASAMPWKGAPEGLRYRPGTNLLEGPLGRLGPGPFLALAGTVAIQADARVLTSGAQGPVPTAVRSGDRLALLWSGGSAGAGGATSPRTMSLFAASAATPAGPQDALVLLEADETSVRVPETLLAIEGRVRAIAARSRGETARLVCAVEGAAESTHLLILEIRARGVGLTPAASR